MREIYSAWPLYILRKNRAKVDLKLYKSFLCYWIKMELDYYRSFIIRLTIYHYNPISELSVSNSELFSVD